MRRNTGRARQVLPLSAEAAVVQHAAAHSFQDRRTQRCELGRLLCDTEELRVHTHLMLGSHPIFAETTTQAVISLSLGSEFCAVVCVACRTLGLSALMLDLGFGRQAELRTDSTAAKGLASRRGASNRETSWIDTLSRRRNE